MVEMLVCLWMFLDVCGSNNTLKNHENMKTYENTWKNPTGCWYASWMCVFFHVSCGEWDSAASQAAWLCLGGLPAAWEVPQPWLSSHLQGANSKPWVELWALSRIQKMRFRQVTAHWYWAWSRKCRVWQCMTMYDNVWYVNSSPPHELII